MDIHEIETVIANRMEDADVDPMRSFLSMAGAIVTQEQAYEGMDYNSVPHTQERFGPAFATMITEIIRWAHHYDINVEGALKEQIDDIEYRADVRDAFESSDPDELASLFAEAEESAVTQEAFQ